MKRSALGLLVFLAMAYVLALPYITVYQIRQAVKARDSVALSEHIDFPSVRQSLKDQLNATLMSKMQSEEMKNNPFAALGMALAGPLVDKMVETYVTPTGVEQLLAGEKPSIKNTHKIKHVEESAANDASGNQEISAEKKPLADVALGYKSTSRFEVKDKKKGTRIVLRRQGLTWKVTEIIFPDDEK